MSLPDGKIPTGVGVGTKFDAVIKQLRDSKAANKSPPKGNEITVLSELQNKKDVSVLIAYLNSLAPILKTSSKLSEEIRFEGNKIYKQPNSNLFEACFLYSLALKCCETQSDFAFCYGNRAAALMKLSFNDVARFDCQQAIRFQHPDKFKIYERLCSLSHNSVPEMRKNLAGLEKNLKKSSKQSREIVQQYKIRLKAMEKENYVDEVPDLSKLKLDDDGELKVKQVYSEEKGRHVIAQKSIAKDDKIFSETPFAFIPVHNVGLKKYFNSDCENCGLVNIWPFLCLDCRMASYCSPKCCEEHKKLHKYECGGYKINLWFEIGIAHLALRCLLVGFPALIKKLSTKAFDKSEFKNQPEKIFQKIVEISGTDYKDVLAESKADDEFQAYAKVIGLLPNLFREEVFSAKNMPYAFTAQLLVLYLRQQTTFFQDHIKESSLQLLEKNSDWGLLVGALLLRHLGQLVSNGHAIIDFRQNIFTTESLKLMLVRNQANGGGLHLLLKSQRVFTGIFPRISMLNHSCAANIRNEFEGNKLTIFATEDIAEGGEVFNCYGPNYKLMSYQERQDSLRLQYNFICDCSKCQEKNDEYRFNNSVLCRFCSQRLYYPDKQITGEDNLDEEEDRNFVLKCKDCHKTHENVAMKKFFTLLCTHQSSNESPPAITMNAVYENYVAAVKGFSTLDEIRFTMTEMVLHTLITHRDAIKNQNAQIPLELSLEVMNVKEELYGPKSIEFLGASLFFLDVVSILTDKGILNEATTSKNPLHEPMVKVLRAVQTCSKDIREIITDYVKRYCFSVDASPAN